MDVADIAARLYPLHSPDAVHDAIAAYLALDVPPANPVGWCRRVAQRAEVNEYRQHSTRDGRPRLIHATGVGVNPSTSTGEGEDVDLDAAESRLYGVQEPEQLRRLEAREQLAVLDPLDLARGWGDLDPAPQDPRPGAPSEESRARERWRHRQNRRRK